MLHREVEECDRERELDRAPHNEKTEHLEMLLFELWRPTENSFQCLYNLNFHSLSVSSVSIVCNDDYDVGESKDCFNEVVLKVNKPFPKIS